jgi:hypothetical protein
MKVPNEEGKRSFRKRTNGNEGNHGSLQEEASSCSQQASGTNAIFVWQWLCSKLQCEATIVASGLC